jgi:hypothetical protein
VAGAVTVDVSSTAFAYVAEYLAAFGLFSVAVWLPGLVLERLALARVALGGLRRLAQVCLGLGFWIAVLFTLAAAGQLHRASVWAVAGLVVAAAGWVLLRQHAGRDTEAHRPQAWRRRLLVSAGLVVLLAPLFLVVLLGFVGWDADVYHLTLPKLYIASHGFRPVAFNVYSNWPLNVELLYALGMLAKDYVLATLVHFGFGVLTLYAIYVGCREFHRPAAGWLAMAFFLCNAVVGWEFTIAYVDLAYAFFFLAGLLFMLRAVARDEGRRASLLLAGLCAGLLAGVKFSGIVGAALMAIPYLAWAARHGVRRFWGECGALVAWFALPALVLWSPWLVKAASYTGNPVYPFLYGWFGGPDWSAALGEQLAAWQRSMGMGRTLRDYLLLPVRVILLGGPGYAHFDGRLNAFWIILVPLALVFGVRDRFARRCLGVAGLYFVFWSVTSQQTRFLIPVLPLLGIAAAIALVRVVERVPRTSVRRGLWSVVIIGTVLGVGRQPSASGDGESKAPPLPPLVLGHVRRPPADSLYAFINDELPPEARVLCLNTNRGFFLDRDYVADSFFEASQIADWLKGAETSEEVCRRLAEKRITHILVEAHDWGIAYPRGLLELLEDRSWVRKLFADQESTLLELRQSMGGASRTHPTCPRPVLPTIKTLAPQENSAATYGRHGGRPVHFHVPRAVATAYSSGPPS